MSVNQQNSKRNDGGEYSRVITEIANDGNCPFCPGPMYLKHHKEPIIEETSLWLFTKSSYPYTGTKVHFFFILKRHAVRIEDLTDEEFLEIQSLLRKYLPMHGITGGSLFMRSGDTSLTGSSVEHIHAHYISREPEHPDPIMVRLG